MNINAFREDFVRRYSYLYTALCGFTILLITFINTFLNIIAIQFTSIFKVLRYFLVSYYLFSSISVITATIIFCTGLISMFCYKIVKKVSNKYFYNKVQIINPSIFSILVIINMFIFTKTINFLIYETMTDIGEYVDQPGVAIFVFLSYIISLVLFFIICTIIWLVELNNNIRSPINKETNGFYSKIISFFYISFLSLFILLVPLALLFDTIKSYLLH